MSTQTTNSSIHNLAERVAKNPDLINSLSEEQLLALREHLNPLGNVIARDESYINISLINWREKYMEKVMMTGLVGYIFRLAEEYECEDEVDRADEKLNKLLETATAEEAKKYVKERDEYVKLVQKTTRGIIKKFLRRHFEYDPDHHVRTASKADRTIRTRSVDMDEKLRNNSKVYDYMRDNILSGYNIISQATELMKSATNVMYDEVVSREDVAGILQKNVNLMTGLRDDMNLIAQPLSNADCVDAWNRSPPADVFYHFNRYLCNHYEEIRDIVREYYNEQPDIEYAAIYYDHYDDVESAREFQVQHESEFRAEVSTIGNNGITLLGPFKQNRERIDFYNKNTEILKRMDEQMKADHSLGKDIWKKQMDNKKKKNIAQLGPDPKALGEYAKHSNTVRELGAKKSMTETEQTEYYEALRAKEDAEVPDDALKVDMFFPQEVDGETRLERTFFYTQPEAPLHLQDGSEYADKYQPKQIGAMDKNITNATIVNRHGQKCSIKTLKNSVADVAGSK